MRKFTYLSYKILKNFKHPKKWENAAAAGEKNFERK
jgi:hypothetical protein